MFCNFLEHLVYTSPVIFLFLMMLKKSFQGLCSEANLVILGTLLNWDALLAAHINHHTFQHNFAKINFQRRAQGFSKMPHQESGAWHRTPNLALAT